MAAPEHAAEARQIVRGDVASVQERKSLRTYAPVAVRGGTGVVVIHQDYAPIARAANSTFLPVAGIFEAVLILLFVALVPILRRVTLRIRRQMDDPTARPLRRADRAAEPDALPRPGRRGARRRRHGGGRAAARRRPLQGGERRARPRARRRAAAGHRRAARRLCEDEIAARLGGDEFAVLLPHGSAELAEAFAVRIHEALEQPFELGGFTIEVAASVGIAVFGEHGEDADALLQHADVAMYLAKGAHAGTAVYSAEQDTNDAERLALAGELRRAIEQEELVVHYQPKADLQTGRIVGVEALVRWSHPNRASSRPTCSSRSPSIPA